MLHDTTGNTDIFDHLFVVKKGHNLVENTSIEKSFTIFSITVIAPFLVKNFDQIYTVIEEIHPNCQQPYVRSFDHIEVKN